ASSADQDQELAVLGANALEQPAGEAVYFPADLVRARFDAGGRLVDTPRYKLDAGRREAPGDVELHADVTDIMVAVEGTATVVTGSTSHTLSAGDVLVIPNGVPHQFV